ncbi:MAG: NAD(P)/FAD-dependent oxidoreductase, partial [Sphaerospermopsis kisseleviana]
VMIQWVWNYFTRNRGARLITGKEMVKPVPVESNGHYQPVNTRQPLNV